MSYSAAGYFAHRVNKQFRTFGEIHPKTTTTHGPQRAQHRTLAVCDACANPRMCVNHCSQAPHPALPFMWATSSLLHAHTLTYQQPATIIKVATLRHRRAARRCLYDDVWHVSFFGLLRANALSFIHSLVSVGAVSQLTGTHCMLYSTLQLCA